MNKLAIILAGGALALTGMAASAETPQRQTLAEKGEARLARMLEGRVAGEPVRCVNGLRGNRISVIENVGIVYDAGGTIYVARATDPRMLDHWDVPVIQRFGSQFCANDVIRTVDRNGGNFTGVVFLNDFVPYTRAG